MHNQTLKKAPVLENLILILIIYATKFSRTLKKIRLSAIYPIFDMVSCHFFYLVDTDVRELPLKNVYKYGSIKIFISHNDYIRYIRSFYTFNYNYFRFK